MRIINISIPLLAAFLCIGVIVYLRIYTPHDHNPDHSHPNPFISGLQTDKARYHPGEEVKLMFSTPVSQGKVNVSYYHLDHKIGENHFTVDRGGKQLWKWSPPSNDYQGYLVKVEILSNQQAEIKTIAIDVSSDWDKFPRYGFLSKFDSVDENHMKGIMNRLNRFHINGIQFYDWHYEHQEPIKMIEGRPAQEWEDISKRMILFNSIQRYISLAHDRNMTTMAYNLLYGSLENKDLPKEWHLFKDREQKEPDVHPLPEDWKSNLEIMNPANPWWQDDLIDKQQAVYKNLGFDGWHIDQLGDRGDVYNEWGDPISLSGSFGPFLQKIKDRIPDKQIVMNAVNQFGQESINEAAVPFLYTEVWDPHQTFNDIQGLLDQNHLLSQGSKNTVLAAYMNYDHSNQEGTFNEAGILLTNSAIFSNGGAHLELGEHMLSKEYFPHDALKMTDSLQQKLIRYYDFLTAYENILRDDVKKSDAMIDTESSIPLRSTAEKGSLWYSVREKWNKQMLHFINLLDADSIAWRDTKATQKIPKERKNVDITIETERKIKKVWFASPDIDGGAPHTLPYVQNGQSLSLTLPSITYWDMVVIEYR